MPTFAQAATPQAKQCIADALATLYNRKPVAQPRALRQPQMLASWRNTPELYRRMVARCAGLPLETANKLDRDLTENEKMLLRSAIRDLRDVLTPLAAL